MITQLFTPNTFASEKTTTGSGFMVNQRGQQFARELIAAPPLMVRNGNGIKGSPVLTAMAGNVASAAVTIDLTTTDEQPIEINGFDVGIIERLVFWGATEAVTANISATTAQGQTGMTFATNEALMALDGTFGAFVSIDVTSIAERIPVVFVQVGNPQVSGTVQAVVVAQGLTAQKF